MLRILIADGTPAAVQMTRETFDRIQPRESTMPDALPPHPVSLSGWTGDLTRVPFWVYRNQVLMKVEQERVFEGPVWNFLCLEDEIAIPGDWRTTVVGQLPGWSHAMLTARSARSRIDASIAAL